VVPTAVTSGISTSTPAVDEPAFVEHGEQLSVEAHPVLDLVEVRDHGLGQVALGHVLVDVELQPLHRERPEDLLALHVRAKLRVERLDAEVLAEPFGPERLAHAAFADGVDVRAAGDGQVHRVHELLGLDDLVVRLFARLVQRGHRLLQGRHRHRGRRAHVGGVALAVHRRDLRGGAHQPHLVRGRVSQRPFGPTSPARGRARRS
jgi:hypothetical protein